MVIFIKFMLAATWLTGIGYSLFSLRRSRPVPLSRWRRRFCLIVGLLGAAEIVFLGLFYVSIGHGIPQPVFLVVMALLFYFNPAVCVLGLLYAVEGAWKWFASPIAGPEGAIDARRRSLINGGLFACMLSPLAPTIAMGRYEQSEQVEVRHYGIEAPYPAERLKIVFMSDFHIGNFFPEERLAGIISFLDQHGPDYVILGGDIVDSHHEELDAFGWFFKSIQSYGEVIAIIGNHDYFGDANIVTEKLERMGIQVLRDAVKTLKNGIPVLGARDYLWESHNHQAFGEIQDERPALLLSHNPDLILKLKPWEQNKVFAAVCGHTHGGQIRLPGMGPIFALSDRRFEPGWTRIAGNSVPVLLSKGIGHTGVPFRLNCPADLLAINLVGTNRDG